MLTEKQIQDSIDKGFTSFYHDEDPVRLDRIIRRITRTYKDIPCYSSNNKDFTMWFEHCWEYPTVLLEDKEYGRDVTTDEPFTWHGMTKGGLHRSHLRSFYGKVKYGDRMLRRHLLLEDNIELNRRIKENRVTIERVDSAVPCSECMFED